MVKTYGDMYLELRNRLSEAGIAAAGLEAREMVCAAAGKRPEGFYRDRALYASEEAALRLEDMALRRLGGEPVAYIIGEWDFMGLTFALNRSVLIPRADTEVLARRAIEMAGEIRGARVLDLCAGCGCIGISVAKNVPDSRIVLADIDEACLRAARWNARAHGLSARAVTIRCDARQEAPPMLGQFDIVCCNPPYIPTGELNNLDDSVRLFEPMLALDGGRDGMDFFRSVAKNYSLCLKRGGHILFECGELQARAVASILERNGYINTEILLDTAGIERVVTARYEG
ncbi:MAG: peptide chain release factor N(5)-glutamine methyltransferase [Oscillospiraceae bacterium]|jgi:release factor glutamine methyltransferase